MTLFYTYTLNHPITGEVKYVGCTTSPKTRLAAHMQKREGRRKVEWIKELESLGLEPTMKIIDSHFTVEEARQSEVRVYDLFNSGALVCSDPRLCPYVFSFKAKKIRIRTKRVIVDDGFVDRIKQAVIDCKIFHAHAIAGRMWPNNSNAANYLSAKLNGKRPFTRRDAHRAMRVLKELGNMLISLTVADQY